MGEVVPFPQSEGEEVAELAKLPLSRLYQLRSRALDEGDLAWASLIDEAVRQVYGR